MGFAEHLRGLTTNRLRLTKHVIALIKLEAKLAKLSIYPLLINLGIMYILLLALWLSILSLIGYGLYVLLGQLIWALFGIVVMNGLLSFLALRNISRLFHQISFAQTRAYLQHKRNCHELPKETTSEQN